MIPLDTFTASPVVSPFLPPLLDEYDPLLMRAPGGAAIGDGAGGREVRLWRVSYAGGTISVAPDDTGVPAFTLAAAGVLSVCLAFDANMAVTLCYTKSDGSRLYFYNSLISAYDTLYLAAASSCRVCVDKTSAFYSGASDVLFVYVRAGQVRWRQQRDRYAVERTAGVAAGELRRAGPALLNRLQVQTLA